MSEPAEVGGFPMPGDLPNRQDVFNDESAKAAEVYYHGVGTDGDLGHYLFKAGMRHIGSVYLPAGFPCQLDVLDGGLMPHAAPKIEGEASLWWVAGWTILAFWDRSGGPRPSSNSAFVIRGDLGLGGAIEAAREAFPEVWDRMAFDVVLPSRP